MRIHTCLSRAVRTTGSISMGSQTIRGEDTELDDGHPTIIIFAARTDSCNDDCRPDLTHTCYADFPASIHADSPEVPDAVH